jgi:hypothetical protein
MREAPCIQGRSHLRPLPVPPPLAQGRERNKGRCGLGAQEERETAPRSTASHFSLSSSLMLTFARVCASTRLTITAAYRPYLSFLVSDPGTTTAPAGTRP